MNPPKEAEEAISAWNIGTPTKWSLAEQGEVNRNFIIRTKQGRYVLRQVLSHSHYGSSKDLEFEFAYLNYLERVGFPYQVPSAVPTREGKLFIKVRGRYCWLYRFIEGTAVERLNESHFEELARMMGRYHILVERSGLDNRKPTVDLFGRAFASKEMECYRSELLKKPRMNRRDAAFMQESAKLVPILHSLDENPYSKLKRYPIHRDIIPENLIWKKNKLVGLIDFEHVSGTNEPTVKDIAVTVQFTCRDRKLEHQLDLTLVKQFLQFYEKWHSVSDEEVELIPILIASSFIEDFVWAYWMLRNDPERAGSHGLKLSSTAAQWSYSNREKIVQAIQG